VLAQQDREITPRSHRLRLFELSCAEGVSAPGTTLPTWALATTSAPLPSILNSAPPPPGAGESISRMHAVELVFAIGWAAFWIYWLVAAFAMKRGHVAWSRELRIRAVVVVLAILLLRLGPFRDGGLNSDPWRAGIGLFRFALGLGFAIWARLNIGRNWGTPMSQKDEPELVTSGPLPPGPPSHLLWILLAGVGTAVALSWLWLVAMALAGNTSSTARPSRSAT
jgi:protein-S-isoprenylcysteine O-methyltransferase Ste14